MCMYVYVCNMCNIKVGISSFKFEFAEDVTEEALIAKVKELNADPAVHGKFELTSPHSFI